MLFVFGGDFKKFESVVQSYDGVIIGGGNLLMSNMGCDYAYRTQKFLSSKYCKEGYVLCCGAGPFEFEQKKLIKKRVNVCKKKYRLEMKHRSNISNHATVGLILFQTPSSAFQTLLYKKISN